MIEHNGIEFFGLRGFSGYYVSVCGKVLSAKFGKKRILKQTLTTRGYLFVNLWTNGICKNMLVHRLIAMTFLANFNVPGLVVDHKDHDRTNNNLHNLRMVPASDNSRNQANAVGVCKYLKENIPYYKAHWYDETGKQRNKWFNVNKLGDEEAHRLATEHRQAMVDLYYNRPVPSPP